MEVLNHHIKTEPCKTRPPYRDSKIPKNVKVYSCVQESKYLLITNIPSINLDSHLRKLFETYGTIEEHKPLHDYPCEEHFDAYLIKYVKIQHARCAKIKLDDYNFYGSLLHVFYAPEHESLDDVREKISERKYIVSVKCNKYESMGYGTPEYAIKSQNYLKNLKEKKSKQKKFDVKNVKTEIVSVKTEKDPMIMFPQLPDNWVRPTATGNASYDDSVNEINNKLKRTIPHQQEIVISKKRKKTLRL